jgi:uncharacterized protein involved in exopolysaccharide biosynthesis/Mrp family chromosome partitioning ATPase
MPNAPSIFEEPLVSQPDAPKTPSADPAASRLSLDSIIGSLRKYRRLAQLAALLVICAGLPLSWWLGTPKYDATAIIYVSPRFLSNLGEGGEQKFESATQYRDYVQQNVRTINRFDIVLEALKKVGGLHSYWVLPGESLERAAVRLQTALAVQQVPDTYQITVSLESANKKGLAELVNRVADIYLEKAKSEEFYASGQRVHSLLQDRARLQQEIDTKQARRMELAQQLGVTTFADGYLNPYDRLLAANRESQSDARRDAIQAEAQLAAFDNRQRAGGTDALHAYAFDQASKDPTLASLVSDLNGRRAQILMTISGLSRDHPGRRAAERELAEMETEKQTAYKRLVDSFSKMMLEQRRADAFKADLVSRKLESEVDRQASRASWFTRGYQEGVQLGQDIERDRKRYDSIEQRLDFFSLEKSAPGYVRLFSSARPPDLPVKGGRTKLFGFFVVAALAVALCLPIAVDLLDPALHSPGDVESILGFAPMAWLIDKTEAGRDFSREQLLRLANRISYDQQNNNSRIFVFTSVKGGGGTSTIVMEAAHALGRLGVSALAVEANAYRADPRYRKPSSRGLTVLLTANTELHSEVVPADEDMPDRLPVGDIMSEKNLPDIQNLVEVLHQAALAYPVVLVDVPPILISADAEFIARKADVVVLVIEAESVTRAELRRAAKNLERIKVPAISALLNRVRGEERNGFGRKALQEFQTGAAPPPPRWSSPWLWK